MYLIRVVPILIFCYFFCLTTGCILTSNTKAKMKPNGVSFLLRMDIYTKENTPPSILTWQADVYAWRDTLLFSNYNDFFYEVNNNGPQLIKRKDFFLYKKTEKEGIFYEYCMPGKDTCTSLNGYYSVRLQKDSFLKSQWYNNALYISELRPFVTLRSISNDITKDTLKRYYEVSKTVNDTSVSGSLTLTYCKTLTMPFEYSVSQYFDAVAGSKLCRVDVKLNNRVFRHTENKWKYDSEVNIVFEIRNLTSQNHNMISEYFKDVK